jgi:vancomycin resistance protein YoaR
VLAFIVAVMALAAFAVSYALGYAALHDGRMLHGVDVAGVSLAGLDRTQAEARLRTELPPLSKGHVTVRIGAHEERIPYLDIGRDYDMRRMLDEAFAMGRHPDPVRQSIAQLRLLLEGRTVEPSVTVDTGKVAERARAVVASAKVPAVDATVVVTNAGLAARPARDGRTAGADDAARLIAAAVYNLNPADTIVQVEATLVPAVITTAQAAAAVDVWERTSADGLTLVGSGNQTIEASDIRRWTTLVEARPGEWSVAIDREAVARAVAAYAGEVAVPPRDATFAFRGDRVVAVGGGNGTALDVEATSDRIVAAIDARAAGSTPPGAVDMALTTVEPDFSRADARRLAPRVEVLSRWTTKFEASPANYNGRNISIPTDMIDGTVVEPGQTFDFLDVIGPITSPPYGPGAAIIRGRTRLDGALGGGMCSTSTTLFNAALRAGLEMGARRNHYYYIDRYPVGLDATVWISSARSRQTMSFTNDMQYPILVRGINRPGKVTFEIWGVADGRTVSFSEPKVKPGRKPRERVLYTDKLAPGRRLRVEWPVDGYKSTVVRTVRGADGSVLHRDTYFSNYRTIDGVTEVGRRPGDPPHGTYK